MHAAAAGGCPRAPAGAVAAQVSVPLWAIVHLPSVVTLGTAAFTPRGWIYIIMYVLFENAMSIVKLWAIFAGALWYYFRIRAACPMIISDPAR